MAERGRPRSFDRKQALSRALDVFWRKGYEGASLSDLTDAMGIASPSLYAAFGSKEALFREAMALYEAVEGPEIFAAVESATTAYAAIEALLLQSARAYTRRGKPNGCMLVLAALHQTEATDALRRDLARARCHSVDTLQAILERGVARDEVASGADLRAIALFYTAVQQGMSIQARDGARREALESIARAALSAWPALTQREASSK
jgi:AcrR family transcriptional regulator